MDDQGRLYFAYGSNMVMAQMERRCPGAKLVSLASLNGYEFRINTRGVATLEPNPGDVVHGCLWQISDADERALDHYEGVALNFYRKLIVRCLDGAGTTRAALAYIATEQESGSPRPGYLEAIVNAARAHRFPEHYIDRLTRWFPIATP